jgi:hypothetical protein
LYTVSIYPEWIRVCATIELAGTILGCWGKNAKEVTSPKPQAITTTRVFQFFPYFNKINGNRTNTPNFKDFA